MHKSLTILGFILFLSAGSVFAQSTETTEAEAEPEAEAPATEEPAAGESLGLDLGTPVGPQVGQTYTKEEFGDWQIRCVKQEQGNDPCQLYQLLKDGTGNSVAEINVFALPEGQQAVAGATLITPLETLLTEQVRLSIDGGEAKRYPFSFCTQIGCISRLGFTAEELNLFRRGASAQVVIRPAAAPDRTVDLSLSLSGFTAGYNAIAALAAAE